MHDIDRDLDADGDVLLILQHPNSPFAVWSEDNAWEPPGPQWPEPEALHESLLEFRAVDPAWLKATSLDLGPESEPVEPSIFEPETAPIEDIPVDAAPVEDVSIQAAWVEDGPLQAVTGEEKQTKFEAVEATSDQGSDIRFRLSSKHLKSASPVFNIMLNGNWKESALTSDTYYTLHSSGWDVEALQIIMDIIHGRSQRVPRFVTLELLAKVAVLVDYYKCHDTVKFFSDTWIENLQTWKHPTRGLCRELILRLFVSYVFDQAQTILELLHFVVREARGPLQTLDLPLPGSVIGMFLYKEENLVVNDYRLYRSTSAEGRAMHCQQISWSHPILRGSKLLLI